MRWLLLVVATIATEKELLITDASIPEVKPYVQGTGLREHTVTDADTEVAPFIRSSTVNLFDSSNGTDHDDDGGDGEEEEQEPYIVFYFMFTSLLLGTLTYALQHRYHLAIPYTVLLFLEGVIIGGLRHQNYFPTLYAASVDMWVNIDPELILFAFLPALLFGEAMGFTWHVFKRAFGQCALLAGPGVILGTLAQAPLMRLIVPSWSWGMCMAFGSIVAATDPVAVVALLKDVGVDRMLTMQVAGESLLNDGVAIVVWTPIQLYMVATYCMSHTPDLHCKTNDAVVTPKSLFFLFLQLAVCGCLLGKMFGWVTVLLFSFNSDKTSHASSTIQLALSLCCAYLAFFIGQSIFGVSGVLCTIFAGVFCGQHAGPIVADKSSLESVWHTLEFGGNTLLFILAGTIFGLTAPHEQSWTSWAQLLFTYLSMMAIRLAMLQLLFPLLKRMGIGCNKKDIYVMWWGGLRGAVGLSLALYMRRLADQGKIEKAYGEKCVWLVAGCAALTLVINATTCSALIDYLGVRGESPQSRKQLTEFVKFAITKSTIRKYAELKKLNQYGVGWIDEKWVARNVSAFRRRDELFAKLFVMIADDAADTHLGHIVRAWRDVCNRDVDASDAIQSDEEKRPAQWGTPRLSDVEAAGGGTLPSTTSLTTEQVRELRIGREPSVVMSPRARTEDNDIYVPKMELEMRSFAASERDRAMSEPVVKKEERESARVHFIPFRAPGSSEEYQRLQDLPQSVEEHKAASRLRRSKDTPQGSSSPSKCGVGQKMKRTASVSGCMKPDSTMRLVRCAKTTDLLMERELRLSMLRSEYWCMIKDGRLPERSEAAQVLLHSVDSAEDVTRWALSDLVEVWDHLKAKPASNNVLHSGWGRLKRFLYAIFVETPARGAGFKLYVPCRTQSGRVIDLCTVVGFLDAHLEVSNKLSGVNGAVLGYMTQARREVLHESNEEIEAIWRFLDEELVTSNDIVAVRTKQLCSMLFRHEATEIEEFYNSGLVRASEYEELLATITRDLKRLAISKHHLLSDVIDI